MYHQQINNINNNSSKLEQYQQQQISSSNKLSGAGAVNVLAAKN